MLVPSGGALAQRRQPGEAHRDSSNACRLTSPAALQAVEPAGMENATVPRRSPNGGSRSKARDDAGPLWNVTSAVDPVRGGLAGPSAMEVGNVRPEPEVPLFGTVKLAHGVSAVSGSAPCSTWLSATR